MSGLQGYELCSFISKNPSILIQSFKRTFVPSVEAIRKIVCDKKDFIFVLRLDTPKVQKVYAGCRLFGEVWHSWDSSCLATQTSSKAFPCNSRMVVLAIQEWMRARKSSRESRLCLEHQRRSRKLDEILLAYRETKN
ncbi:uncharacterized protein LOC114175797 isoform X2 [Vigna unguiculata]|uniref:uncharacterized protein LOC114175797 isoform X2 n=1 Tax=Vigna unguiculata TaxID=3917 RepID=UPI00101676C2|nr:uncharacterized protein LOC114175797 isoform X2 [Vigna unguiculata]